MNFSASPQSVQTRHIKRNTTFISTASLSKRLQNLNISRVHYLASLRLSRYLLIMITPSSRCKLGWARARSHISHTFCVFVSRKTSVISAALRLLFNSFLKRYSTLEFTMSAVRDDESKAAKSHFFSPWNCSLMLSSQAYRHISTYTTFTPFSSTQFIQIKS